MLKRTIRANELDWHQESPCRIQVGSLGENGERETDDHTGSDIDDKSPVVKLRAHPVGNRSADPVSGHRAERTAKRDKKVFCKPMSS